jgi:hypothetical protein
LLRIYSLSNHKLPIYSTLLLFATLFGNPSRVGRLGSVPVPDQEGGKDGDGYKQGGKDESVRETTRRGLPLNPERKKGFSFGDHLGRIKPAP